MTTTTTWILYNNITDKQISDIIYECLKYNIYAIKLDHIHLKVIGDKNIIKTISNNYINLISHIIGLEETSSQLHTYLKHNTLHSNVVTYLTPLQIAEIYNFPSNLNGSGITIGIIELGGGYQMSDITTYLTDLGINPNVINITDVSVDGAQNTFLPLSNANIEVILDIEVIVALVPNANIRVYFAPNSFVSFYNAILTAINDGCHVISISWGLYESGWGNTNLNIMNNLFQTAAQQNITITVASGDLGSSDGAVGNNVDFPGSSIYSLCCGGSTLDATNNIRNSEIVWNNNPTTSASGGGISSFFTTPTYQNNVVFNLNGYRGVPDVSGNADPNSGYIIYYNSQYIAVGGTSAVAPLYAALIAKINQSIGSPVGFINQTLYDNPSVFYDITSGNNGAFTASVAWDACSGMGVFNGQLLLNLLTPQVLPVASFTYTPISGNIPLTVTFTNTSTNALTYLWDFGNGNTSTSINPVHTFNTVNTFNVTLTVTNNNGNDSVTHQVITSNPYPTASFTYEYINNTIPLIVEFINTSTNAFDYIWDFGDGSFSFDISPTHTYMTEGTYEIILTAINNFGTNTTQPVIIVIGNPAANFAANITNGKQPLKINFINLSQNGITYLWDFGDGYTSNDSNPVHIYHVVGLYTVSLSVINNMGTNKLTKVNYINVLPKILEAEFKCKILNKKKHKIKFINKSLGVGDEFLWHFGDGTTAIDMNPKHKYKNKGTYYVTLRITVNGYTSSRTHSIHIH
jgi:PKD repeat protein